MGKSLIHRLNHIFPPLKSKGLKGEHGRIGVIGGSYEFTGAPFYSAMSALKAGADLAHIFCSKSSSVSIKSYSPEIIVHPIFTSEEEVRYSKEDRKKVIGEWL
jgi:ATP-dependent NAD(P)H-hydrate dehydratase